MAQNEAKEALYTHIEEALGQAKSELNASSRAEAVKNLAVAYRLVMGGPQPGSAVVSK